MPRRNLVTIAAVVALTLLTWQSGRGARPEDEMMELYGIFVDAVEKVEANYVREVPRKELLESALRGMLADLDPHSNYFSEPEWKQFRKQIEGSFTGIGVSIDLDPDSGRLKILSPLPGSPAFRAGILPGDQILEVDGQSTEGITRDKAVEVLQGRPGTSVKLKVLHNGTDIAKAETVVITREIIELPSVLGDRRKADGSWDFMLDKDKKIGYIRLNSFNEDTANDLEQALEQLKKQGVRGLVLDLRDNPGGLLSSAVEISDLFLENGKIVTTKGRNTRDAVYDAEPDDIFEDVPMAVLINQHSASASEIVSSALQDHDRATIVGQRSFGKGSVQSILPLDNGESILKLTVATYWRPSGKNIHRFKDAKPSDEWGVSPNDGMEVKLNDEEYEHWFEERLERDQNAIEKPNQVEPEDNAAKPREDKPPGEEAAEPFVDKQLDKALEVVKGKIGAADAERDAQNKAE